jgi:dihydrofolate reductase
MRKIVLSMHITLDGFVAGTNGEMDWIKVDDELFEKTGKLTSESDTALYGRVTFQMMDNYWPTAADNPKASKHDIEHSEWYNRVNKIILSKTLSENVLNKVTVISDNIPEKINQLKQQEGKNILIFGSPSAAHVLMQHDLIDEYWLFINPVILGNGIPLFSGINEKIKLKTQKPEIFSNGVIALHYSKE